MKVICQKHERWHESTELCPWCEPSDPTWPREGSQVWKAGRVYVYSGARGWELSDSKYLGSGGEGIGLLSAIEPMAMAAGKFDGQISKVADKHYVWIAHASPAGGWVELRPISPSVVPLPFVHDPDDDSSLLGWGRND